MHFEAVLLLRASRCDHTMHSTPYTHCSCKQQDMHTQAAVKASHKTVRKRDLLLFTRALTTRERREAREEVLIAGLVEVV
jgi:hypothetical protein